jgi:hypothetical protein
MRWRPYICTAARCTRQRDNMRRWAGIGWPATSSPTPSQFKRDGTALVGMVAPCWLCGGVTPALLHALITRIYLCMLQLRSGVSKCLVACTQSVRLPASAQMPSFHGPHPCRPRASSSCRPGSAWFLRRRRRRRRRRRQQRRRRLQQPVPWHRHRRQPASAAPANRYGPTRAQCLPQCERQSSAQQRSAVVSSAGARRHMQGCVGRGC